MSKATNPAAVKAWVLGSTYAVKSIHLTGSTDWKWLGNGCKNCINFLYMVLNIA